MVLWFGVPIVISLIMLCAFVAYESKFSWRWFWTLIFFVCLAASASAQGGAYFSSNAWIASRAVSPGQSAPILTVPYARVYVCNNPATPLALAPCTNQINVYSDVNMTQAIPQPVVADAQGVFSFYVPQGYYAFSLTNTAGTFLGTYGFSIAGAGAIGPPGTPGTVTATGVNGSFTVPGTLTANALKTVFPNAFGGIRGYTDSNGVGIGTTTGGGIGAANVYSLANSKAYFTIVANAVGGQLTQCGEGGSQNADGTAELFGKRTATTGCGVWGPKAAGNPLVQVHFGTNATYHCGLTTGCQLNERAPNRTMMTWTATSNKTYAVNCTGSGWNADNYLAQYARVSAGTLPLTCSINVPVGATGIALAYEATGASGPSATIAIDGGSVGTVQGYGFNGQSVTTGFIGTTTAVWSEIYGGLTPGTHMVTITPNGAGFGVVGVSAPDDPAKRLAGSARVEVDGVPQQVDPTSGAEINAAFTAALDADVKANVALAQSVGFPVVFGDFRAIANVPADLAANNYTFTNPDLTTTTCVASTQPGAHFSDCGHAKNALAIINAIGGSLSGTGLRSPLKLGGAAGDMDDNNAGGLGSQTAVNPGWAVYNQNGRPHAAMLTWLSDIQNVVTGMTGTFAYGIAVPRGDCFAPEFYTANADNSPPTTQVGWRDPFVVCDNGTRLLNGAIQTNLLLNGTGLQQVSAQACTMSSGAIGNSCTGNVPLSVPEADTNYVVSCGIVSGSDVTIGPISSQTTTQFSYKLYAMSASSTGGGFIGCHVTHL